MSAAPRLMCRQEALRYLKLSDAATENEIRKSFHKLALKYHPDKVGGSVEKMSKLNEAYEVLTGPQETQGSGGGFGDDVMEGFFKFASKLPNNFRELDTTIFATVSLDTLLTHDRIRVTYPLMNDTALVAVKEFSSSDFFHPFKSRVVFTNEGFHKVPNPTDLVLVLNVADYKGSGYSLKFTDMGELEVIVNPGFLQSGTIDVDLLGLKLSAGRLRMRDQNVDLQSTSCFQAVGDGQYSPSCFVMPTANEKFRRFKNKFIVDPVIKVVAASA